MTVITHATPADLPDILQMIRALSAFHGDQAQVTPAQLHNIFFGPAPVATALVAHASGEAQGDRAPGDRALGYAGLTPTVVIHNGTVRLDIHHLYVHERHRGQGIGTALIMAAKAHAEAAGATRLTIGTDAGNATAIAAYRAMPVLEQITGEGPRFRIALDT